MIVLPHRLLASIVLLGAVGCQSDNAATDSRDASVPTEILEFENVFNVSELDASNGQYFILDGQSREVYVFDQSGDIVHTFGSEGEGPGEMRNPQDISVMDDRVAVSERSGRVSIFNASGQFLHSFMAHGVVHINSNMMWLDSDRIFIGGLRESAGELYGGYVGHVYDSEGTKLYDFLPLTDVAGTYETTLVLGANCDLGNTDRLYCTQPVEHSVDVFDLSGNHLEKIRVVSEEYSGIDRPQPEDLRSDDGYAWISSWDKVMDVYVVDESIFLMELYLKSGSTRLDIVDRETNTVLRSHDIKGRVVDFDPEAKKLYVLLPATDQPVATVQVIDVHTLY